MGIVAKTICHVVAAIVLATSGPIAFARDNDKVAERNEQRRLEREARNGEKSAEAKERRKDREERDARKQSRAEERRQERDERRAREQTREETRDKRREEKKHTQDRSQETARHEGRARNEGDGSRYKRDEDTTSRQRQARSDTERQGDLDSAQRKLDRVKNSASYKRLEQFSPEEIIEIKRQGKTEEFERYIDKGGRKPTVNTESKRNTAPESKDKHVTTGDSKRSNSRPGEISQSASEKAQIEAQNRRAKEFSQEDIAELRKQGKVGELNLYVAYGGRKPQIEVFDEKRGHWVTKAPTGSHPGSTGTPTGAASPTPVSKPAVAATFPVQSGRPASNLNSADVLKSSADLEWLSGLNRQQRRVLDKYPPEQLLDIQRAGRWQAFKEEIGSSHSLEASTPGESVRTGVKWGLVGADSPSAPSTSPQGRTANSTPSLPTPGTPSTTLPVIGAGIAIGAAVTTPFVVPAESIAAVGNVAYIAIKNGQPYYVGITNNLKRRIAEHAFDSGISVQAIEGLTNVSRAEARAVEQVLIERYGLGRLGGQLQNSINSIAKDNPVYEQSIKMGQELLRSSNWPGF